jgi:hypothetical protein
VFDGSVLATLEGLETLKQVFIRLLIATNQDFALRSVPRGKQFGTMSKQGIQNRDWLEPIQTTNQTINLQHFANTDELPPINTGVTGLRRIPSAEFRAANNNNSGSQVSPILLRELSDDMTARFSEIKRWDETDHPLCLFYSSSQGEYVDGMDILSLNSDFLSQYIPDNIKASLVQNHIELDRDWKAMTSEQGIEIIRKVEGKQLKTNINTNSI